MFVGFIAVVVILLVIVGLMSSGSTSGSGGVDQTKATKALTEISALVQSAGFYQTTTADSNYAGLNIAALVASGIVATEDTITTLATGHKILAVNVAADTAVADSGVTTLIASKAVAGLFYDIAVNPTANSGFILRTAVDTNIATGSTLAKALESSYGKLLKGAYAKMETDVGGTLVALNVAAGAIPGVYDTGVDALDGIVNISFK